jgi:hypothetical protein
MANPVVEPSGSAARRKRTAKFFMVAEDNDDYAKEQRRGRTISPGQGGRFHSTIQPAGTQILAGTPISIF